MHSIAHIMTAIHDARDTLRVDITGGRRTWNGDPIWSVTLDFREHVESGRGIQIERQCSGDDLVAVLNEAYAAVVGVVKKGVGPRALMPPASDAAE